MYESVEHNKDCLDPISLEVQRLGGVVPFFGMMGIFLLLALLVFSMLSYRSQLIIEQMKELREVLYEVWEEENEQFRGRVTEDDFRLNDQSIWCFTHRMYFIGFNTSRFPWFIPKDFPRDGLKKQDREKFIRFIDEINEKLKYTFMEKMMLFIGAILFPPLSKQFNFWMRKKKFKML